MKIDKFWIAIIIGILSVVLVAWIDIQGFNLLGDKYTNGEFPATVWPHHLITAIIIFLIPALCYFFFYRKDKSEFAAVFFSGLIMFYFGLADVGYFILQGKSVPFFLYWLNNHIVIGTISKTLGFAQVTSISLYISVGIGLFITYQVVKFLKEKL